jgi:hypothetical protein
MAVSVARVGRAQLPEAGILVGGAGVLGAAWILPQLWARGVNPMPPCLFHQLTGLSCPFCGGTRSFAAMAHGNVAAAAHVYPLGPLLFAGLIAALALAMYTLLSGRRFTLALDPVARNRLITTAVVLLALNWSAKLLFLGY